MKRLYKSKENKIFSGIIGGLGEYFNIDPVILRLLWVVILISTGIFPGILVYMLAIFIIPKKPEHGEGKKEEEIKR